MSNNKLIPQLRFPEFKNEGEWVEKNVGEVYDFKITNSFSREYLNYAKGHVKNIHYGDIHTKFNTLFDITKERVPFINQDVSIEKIKKESYCIEGDIIFADASEDLNDVGKSIELINLNNEKLVSGLHTLLARQREIKLSIGFGGYLFKSEWIRKQIQKEAQGAKVLGISATRISNIKILFPNNPQEQQKIASCLSSLDEVIAAHSQKLDLLKDHKKGLMQNLFPQEGEKVPKYRFKEFENDGEWVEKKLGELIELKGRIGYRGYTLEDIVGKGEGAISMSPSNINEFGTLSFTKSTYITWAKYEESPEIILQNGFTVLVKTGSTFGKVAFIKNLNEKTTINPQLVVLKPKKVDSYFLYLLVSNTAIQKQINETVVGGTIPTLSQESISKFEILVPKPKEQEKIADCLSSLNDLIISQTERIAQLKWHKKGLMQGLFPKIND